MARGGVTPSVDESDPFSGGTGPYKSTFNKTEKLKAAHDNVRGALKWREQEGYDDTWKRMRDLYRLRHDKMGYQDGDSIAVAISFATINVIAPSVSVNHPKITVLPRKEEDVDKATITEAVVNYWWKHYNFQPEFRRAVKDFLVYGLGICKVGYKYEESEREATPEEIQQEVDGSNEQLDQFAAENPHMAHDLPTHQDVVDAVPLTTIETVHDAPFVERISPFDFFIDPEATCLDDAKYLAQRIVLPLERVKEDERYNAAARRALNADGSVKWQIEDDHANAPTPPNGRVTIWEYYDTETKEFSVFADQEKVGYLVDPQDYPYPFGLPFVLIENYDVPDAFYPIGELEAIEPLQYELDATRSSMVRARKLDVPKFIARKGAFDQTAKDALGSDTPYRVAETDNDRALNDLIIPLPRNDANAQLYQNHSEVIEADINLVTGVNDYMRGAQSEIRRTATEASIIQDAANARAADKLAIIEHAISEIARRLVGLAQHYLEGEQVARVVGAAGAMTWVPFTADDIAGEYDFDVEGGSTQPQNETFRRQQAMQLLQTMTPFIQMGVINVPVLLGQVLREGFGLKNPEKFLQAPPPPMGVDPVTGEPTDPSMQGGMPPDQQGGPPPDQGGAPPQQQGGDQQGIQGVPPEVLAQLQNQYGLLQGQ